MAMGLSKNYTPKITERTCPVCETSQKTFKFSNEHRHWKCSVCSFMQQANYLGDTISPAMQLRYWPESQDEYVSFESLVEPLYDAIKFAYKMERQNEGRDIPYKGFEDVQSVGSLSVDESLRWTTLSYNEEDQGWDALHTILGVALRVGMEQQRRVMLSNHGHEHRAMYHVEAAIEEAIEEFDGFEKKHKPKITPRWKFWKRNLRAWEIRGLEDRSNALLISGSVRAKLQDLNGLDDLEERRSALIERSLTRSKERNEELRKIDPKEFKRRQAKGRAMIDSILSEIER